MSLEAIEVEPRQAPYDITDIDDALRRLTVVDPRQGQLVELRVFGGLTDEEIGEVLKVSARTVRRDWSSAKAWLGRELA